MSVTARVGQGKRLDPTEEREVLIHVLRTAVSRTRLITATLEAIGVHLHHRQITTEQAYQWIRDENLTQYLQFGRRKAVHHE
jgi:hypothetical protein